VKGDPKTGYFPDNSNVYLKHFMHISEYVAKYSLQKLYFRNNGITWVIPITVYVIVQIKDFQNREEGRTQEGRIDTKETIRKWRDSITPLQLQYMLTYLNCTSEPTTFITRFCTIS
jgi:hypothetical protein